MPKSKSSQRWLKEHFADPFVKKAQQEGFRARSVYKLSEIDAKYKLIKPGLIVIDLGAAPGGWSQYVSEKLKKGGDKHQGMLIATDILPMDPLAGVHFIQGDFTSEEVYTEILAAIKSRGVDLVLSDMAPNLSGTSSVDQPKSMYLAELATDMAYKVLKNRGNFLTKVFQGTGFDDWVKGLRAQFKQVKFIKPKASRPRSRELYVLALDYTGSGKETHR